MHQIIACVTLEYDGSDMIDMKCSEGEKKEAIYCNVIHFELSQKSCSNRQCHTSYEKKKAFQKSFQKRGEFRSLTENLHVCAGFAKCT